MSDAKQIFDQSVEAIKHHAKIARVAKRAMELEELTKSTPKEDDKIALQRQRLKELLSKEVETDTPISDEVKAIFSNRGLHVSIPPSTRSKS